MKIRFKNTRFDSHLSLSPDFVPHLREAKVGIVCGSKRPSPSTDHKLCPLHHTSIVMSGSTPTLHPAAFRTAANTSSTFQSLLGHHPITRPSFPIKTVESEC